MFIIFIVIIRAILPSNSTVRSDPPWARGKYRAQCSSPGRRKQPAAAALPQEVLPPTSRATYVVTRTHHRATAPKM